jgi:hypothetical protein
MNMILHHHTRITDQLQYTNQEWKLLLKNPELLLINQQQKMLLPQLNPLLPHQHLFKLKELIH